MGKYRDWIITLGAVICFAEFWSVGYTPNESYIQLVGALHIAAALVLLITLVLYVSMWRVGWVLFLRVIFAGFIIFMLITSFKEGINLLNR